MNVNNVRNMPAFCDYDLENMLDSYHHSTPIRSVLYIDGETPLAHFRFNTADVDDNLIYTMSEEQMFDFLCVRERLLYEAEYSLELIGTRRGRVGLVVYKLGTGAKICTYSMRQFNNRHKMLPLNPEMDECAFVHEFLRCFM